MEEIASRKFEFNKTCRACLSKNVDSKFLFDEIDLGERSIQLSDMLMKCADIQVSRLDGLPTLICNECIKKVAAAYTFRNLCEQSDTFLRQQIDELSDEIESNSQVPITDESTIVTASSHVNSRLQCNEPTKDTFCEYSPMVDEAIKKYIQKNKFSNALNNLRHNIHLCTKCFECFTTEEDLKEHFKTHQKPTRYLCTVCNVSFSKAHILERHSKTHEAKEIHLCIACGKVFKKNVQLRRHMRTHTDERPHACELCDKRYRQPFLLKEHMRSHTNDKYICSVCGKSLSTYNGMNIHMKMHKGQKDHQCAICGSKFIAPGQLTVHMRVHTNEKPHLCSFVNNDEVCNKAFRTKAALELHLRTHTGERPYKCPHCPKSFPSTSRLTQHIRSHTGEKPYCCEVCDKCFFKSQDLRKHVRLHTVELPFQCDICMDRFISNDRLKTHKKAKHMDNKHLECIVCHESFPLAVDLNKHMLIHNEGKSFICETCGRAFALQNSLVLHLKSHKITSNFLSENVSI